MQHKYNILYHIKHKSGYGETLVLEGYFMMAVNEREAKDKAIKTFNKHIMKSAEYPHGYVLDEVKVRLDHEVRSVGNLQK